MNPRRCNRHQLEQLTDLPNVGLAMAAALQSLGYQAPADLDGCDAFLLYQSLSQQRGCRQDPCVLDVLLSIQRFLAGEQPQPWWAYSQERRRRYPQL
ncbi:mitomycin resistance protein [Cyanobium sp. LEGE 06143]|uniref:helix-hairpin-helix domain-containing protein n=1 Tax=Cyanobium sp. LEGE 06143 TaxID=945727 RepID=UPI00187EAD59|nr:helix-hairpin-helix domain-containing protein [Cyanobium sp. LEGE 06143]MBE9171709.1 mitomycin resistance protein [Cyanobium sp. LEGE 06143]